MSEAREKLKSARRWVVKIGSALLTDNGCGLKLDTVTTWADQITQLIKQGNDVVLVSSGAVAEGITRLGWKQRPTALNELQVAAAVGQMGLIQAWETSFQKHALHTAQILLTHDDIADRNRYLNARSTLRQLVKLGVIPVVNENDSVATEEIQFGDNDHLAGLVTNLIEADLLVLLTDQDGLYDKDPRHNSDARLIHEARAGDPALDAYAGSGGILGRGGMLTKLKAAATAAKSGANTVIASGLYQDSLIRIASGDEVGTLLYSDQEPLAARKQWLAGHTRVAGRITLDDGAVRVLKEQGKSLLAVGVTGVDGNFVRGEVIACVDNNGREVARGLVNYNAQETRKIMGKPSSNFVDVLGYADEPELIHRDNLILI
ncbi:MAG: glutamate 5-kinase [Gammaproteobacteria bacterium]|nr:glutamate 5-kinase [Gammaproteobacteria bacterium]